MARHSTVHVRVFDRNGRRKITAYDDSMRGWPDEEDITDYVMSYPAKEYPDHIVEVDDGSLAWRYRTSRVAGQPSVRLLRKPTPSSERPAAHATKKSAAQLDADIAEALSSGVKCPSADHPLHPEIRRIRQMTPDWGVAGLARDAERAFIAGDCKVAAQYLDAAKRVIVKERRKRRRLGD